MRLQGKWKPTTMPLSVVISAVWPSTRLGKSHAEKEAQQNRSEGGRQRRTSGTPEKQFRHRYYLHYHPFRFGHLRITSTARSLFQRQISAHWPVFLKPKPKFILFSNYVNPCNSTTQTLEMEVEVKLRLPDSTAHESVSSLLSPYLIETHHQHNIFFDGAASELSSRRAVLRLRFYGDAATAPRCVVSLKAKAILLDGVSRVEEDEEELDPSTGREILSDPSIIGSVSESRVLKRVVEEFGVKNNEYVCLGGFKNVREVYHWNELKLELDKTMFEFGTLYEIECESIEPEKAKEAIENLLKENGIHYSYSNMSKFAIFRAGKLPELPPISAD